VVLAAVAVRFDGAVKVGAPVVAEAVLEKPLKLPAASVVRTRYEYEVEPVSPASSNVVATDVPT
jgi:hypothetical protein